MPNSNIPRQNFRLPPQGPTQSNGSAPVLSGPKNNEPSSSIKKVKSSGGGLIGCVVPAFVFSILNWFLMFMVSWTSPSKDIQMITLIIGVIVAILVIVVFSLSFVRTKAIRNLDIAGPIEMVKQQILRLDTSMRNTSIPMCMFWLMGDILLVMGVAAAGGYFLSLIGGVIMFVAAIVTFVVTTVRVASVNSQLKKHGIR